MTPIDFNIDNGTTNPTLTDLHPKDFYQVEIQIKDVTSVEANAITRMRVPMILPHELLNYLTVPLSSFNLCFFLLVRDMFFPQRKQINLDFGNLFFDELY